MKANELMVGDWVVYRGDTEYTNPVRIEGMDALTCALITEDREDVGFDGIEPIPLTAEILEKNGFRDIGGHWYDDAADYYELEVEAYSDSIWRVIYHNTEFNIGDERVFVGYIHELQHALRLFGIKREIEL